jgi:hypothetical protein
VCLMCTPGTYTPTIGASICTPCPSCDQNGYYMSNCSGTSSGAWSVACSCAWKPSQEEG